MSGANSTDETGATRIIVSGEEVPILFDIIVAEKFTGAEYLEARCRAPAGTDVPSPVSNYIGTCKAFLVRRDRTGPDFYDKMDEISRDTGMLALDVFEPWGEFKEELKTDPLKSGTQVWGEELGTMDFLYIEYLLVDKAYRCHGLGQKLVEYIQCEARKKSQEFTTIVWPSTLLSNLKGDLKGKSESDCKDVFQLNRKYSIRYFRRLGFRRIGVTRWFGFSSDRNHPSRQLAAEEDYDPPPN
ncbi:hypothetical protein AJ79_09796 [Helicocarpus griseus UAMH5409]|uniref:N-acetyltransferase domain-containing protein n=1 Tax=Helicocarpus griseus UAMH5409 TaxID=1447875 RepID=A0A2B7WHE6_9EURO|nr:hypothetical protein AJ79_09796 [Helicocarpus griseus UAMH5409]